MKRVVLRYGLYAMLAIVVLSGIHLLLIRQMSWANAEIAGYLSMILSMIFVFMGIRYYRDHVNNGSLGFGQGLKVGILIVLIPSVAFGLFDLLYTEVLNPSWMDEYYGDHIRKLKETAAPDQLAGKLKKLEEEREMFSNPLVQFLLMSVTVFIIGFIVTIISSLALMRKKKGTAIA